MSPFQISETILDICQWCNKYLSLTRRLNKIIREEDIDELDSVLNTRQYLLEMLPGIMTKELVKESSDILLDYINNIKELERSSIRLLKSKENDILHHVCDIRRCRSSQLCRGRKKSAPQFIDKLS
ncbi:MAG: hypothetical protein K8T10_08065 [Candidatus Eremiobacteraeota bacterium]|nr:hypothetical protein [Candidatus Eremiobacteraeota bacterium]